MTEPNNAELSVRQFDGKLCEFNCPFVKIVKDGVGFCLLFRCALRYTETGNNDLCYRCEECRWL